MANPSCKKCIYFQSLGTVHVFDGDDEEFGYCHFNPPLPDINTGRPLFPQVDVNTWCGKLRTRFGDEVVMPWGELR